MEDNQGGDLTINNIELAAYLSNLNLFAPKMAPLEQIHTIVDNMAAEGWARRGRVNSSTAVGTLLQEAACIMRQAHIHRSVEKITGLDNK